MFDITIRFSNFLTDFEIALLSHRYNDIAKHFEDTIKAEISNYEKDLSNKIIDVALDGGINDPKPMDRREIIQDMFNDVDYKNAAERRIILDALGESMENPPPDPPFPDLIY